MLHHFRTDRGEKVDAVLEHRDGRVIGVEVEAGRTVAQGDFRGIDALDEAAGPGLHLGLVPHTGAETVLLDERRWAVPVSVPWR